MSPDQITKIRQFIKNWQDEAGKYITKTKFEAVLVDVINTKCESLLTFLPCETCGGTGQVTMTFTDDLSGGKYGDDASCPDCKINP